MTREEAITYLNVIWNRYKAEYEIERETLDAYHMAIEALSADAVSRKDTVTLNSPISIQAEMVAVVRCKDCRHGEHIQIPLWENRDIDKAPSQFHDFIKCHKFHIKGFNETLYLGDDDYCSHGERREP